MKLYATILNSKGKKESKGDDKWLEIELSCKNNYIGKIILDYHGGLDWELSYERPTNPSYLIDSCITPKAKKRKGEIRACDVCSELYEQRKDSTIAGKNGQFEKVYLCPKHQGCTR